METTYTSYVRKHIVASDLSSAAGGLIYNVNAEAFAASTGGGTQVIVAWALCDASSAGNMLYFGLLPVATPSISIVNTNTPTLAIGTIVIAET